MLVDSAALEAARRFTVAIHAIRPASSDDHESATLTSDQPAGESGSPGDRGPLRRIEGTGVIIDRSGLILTNQHVIRDASDLRVWSPELNWRRARLVGADVQSDLAVIAVDDDMPCAARLGDGEPITPGEPVVALGYTPGGPPLVERDGPTVLPGRLTATQRSLQGALDPAHKRYYGDLLESTVPLLPGHSGGALINRTGAVIGINTAAVTHYRTGQRTGYAIPIAPYQRAIIERIARGETVVHGYLGLLVRALDGGAGVPVERVVPDGPAHRAGLRRGDVIVRYGGAMLTNAAGLAELIRRSPPDRPVSLSIMRGQRQLEVMCRPVARPAL